MLYNLILTIYLFNGSYDSELFDSGLTQQQCATSAMQLKKFVLEVKDEQLKDKTPKGEQIETAVIECKAVDQFRITI